LGKSGHAIVPALACLLVLPGPASAADATLAKAGHGEALYRFGTLSSGQPLVATNAAGAQIQGPAAACINCHRRSGLGSKEGRELVPPVTGRYLFRPRGGGPAAQVPFVETMRGDREPYTDATLARAIREGIDSQGKPLRPLMPRFQIGDADMAELIGYLKGALDQRSVPGVTEKVVHFATIITPDADPTKRHAMLAVLEQYVAERNARQMSARPSVQSARGVQFMTHRQWQLQVWELTGAPSTWQDQLRQHMKRQPVFAVISGLAGRTWAPIHAFCEEDAVPCLFPNVEAPVDVQHDFYSVYFSRGVYLEVGLIANAIAEGGIRAPAQVRQVYRAGDVGEVAAEALATALARQGIKVTRSVLPAGEAGSGVAQALRGASGADALVLWLRPADLAKLGDATVAPPAVFASGLMGGLELAPLAPAWRERTHLSYPFDLPDKRRVRMDFAFGWFRIRKIPVEAVQVQADTWLACGLLSETVNHLSDAFFRPYLIERIEDMLEHRVLTGYYPRLSLATGQRFASKGGYMVRFVADKGSQLMAETDWLVPTFERPAGRASLP
jgi:hypothetical protein